MIIKRSIIVAGSRTTPKYIVDDALYDLFGANLIEGVGLVPMDIVSGCALGADSWGEQWAKENGIPVTEFKADWQHIGNRAGLVRNEEMADYADMLIAFWDGESKGTKHMINCMQKRMKNYMVFYFNE